MKTILNKIFSKEDVNNSRQIEIDIAKAICIIGMVFVHCFEVGESYGLETPLTYFLVFVLNTCFGASIFMTCMGIGLAYTKKNAPIQIIKRGIVMFLFSLLFNLLRNTSVQLLKQVVLGEFSIPFLISTIFYVDILTFAGIALILFGLLKLVKTPYWLMLIIALTMSALGTIFQAVPTNSWISTMLVCPFMPTIEDPVISYNAYFPLFNWFIFIVLGYGFGLMLKKVKNKGLFYAIVSGVCGVFAIVYLAICIPNQWGLCCPEITNTMFIKVYDSLICFAIAVATFGLYYAISHILPEIIKRFFMFLSKGITIFYVTHWMLLCVLGIFMILIDNMFIASNVFICLLTTCGVFIVSCFILILINKINKRKNINKTS